MNYHRPDDFRFTNSLKRNNSEGYLYQKERNESKSLEYQDRNPKFESSPLKRLTVSLKQIQIQILKSVPGKPTIHYQ